MAYNVALYEKMAVEGKDYYRLWVNGVEIRQIAEVVGRRNSRVYDRVHVYLLSVGQPTSLADPVHQDRRKARARRMVRKYLNLDQDP